MTIYLRQETEYLEAETQQLERSRRGFWSFICNTLSHVHVYCISIYCILYICHIQNLRSELTHATEQLSRPERLVSACLGWLVYCLGWLVGLLPRLVGWFIAQRLVGLLPRLGVQWYIVVVIYFFQIWDLKNMIKTEIQMTIQK